MTKNWEKWAQREGVDITTLVEVDRAFYGLLFEFTGKYEEVFFTTLKDRVFTHYTKVGHREFGRFLYQKYFNNEEDIKRFIEKGNKILAQTRDSAKRCKRLTKGSKTELISALELLIKQFAEVNYYYSIMSFAAIEAWQKDFQEVFDKIVSRNKFQENVSEMISIFYKPWKKSALMSFQEKIKKRKDIDRLVKHYQFLRSWSLVWHEPIKKENFLTSIKKSKEQKSWKISRSEAIKLLKPNSEEKKFLELAQYMIYLKDWRDDLRRRQAFDWSFIFDEVSKCLGIVRDDLGYLSLGEILNSVKTGKANISLINQRKRGLCLVTSRNPKSIEMEILSERINGYLKIIKESENKEEISEIKGVTAQKGKVSGKVQIIHLVKDIPNFKKGGILVSNSTHPNYLLAMHKAKAIVTNEGGVACHAAIVSRELGIPCIVGTKTATKLLKDGDWVEVDANKGIVRKIRLQN